MLAVREANLSFPVKSGKEPRYFVQQAVDFFAADHLAFENFTSAKCRGDAELDIGISLATAAARTFPKPHRRHGGHVALRAS